MTFEQAENLKQGQGVEGHSPDAVAPILSSVSESVLLEVQKTFDFFKATTSEDRIDRVVLSGGSARIPGLADSMGGALRLPGRDFQSFPERQLQPQGFRRGVSRRSRARLRHRGGPGHEKGWRPMIRINLLGVREAGRWRMSFDSGSPAVTPSEKKGLLVAVLFLGGAIACIVLQWLSAREHDQQLDEEIQTAHSRKSSGSRRSSAGAGVPGQAHRARGKREALIERLKREREGPVRMLDELSAELPDFVWIEQLQQGRNNVTIRRDGGFLRQYRRLHSEARRKR